MKKLIVEYLEGIIWKRGELVKEYPGDLRNAQCVKELGEFAEFIKSLDDNDERLKKIENCQPNGVDDVYFPSETVKQAIFRFGFHKSQKEKFDSFFTWMADTDTEEWNDVIEENDENDEESFEEWLENKEDEWNDLCKDLWDEWTEENNDAWEDYKNDAYKEWIKELRDEWVEDTKDEYAEFLAEKRSEWIEEKQSEWELSK